jgi:hypothetical protein
VLGVTRTNNDGARRLMRAAAEASARAVQSHDFTDEECDERSRRALRLNLAEYL